MKKRIPHNTRHLISTMARLGAAALVIAGLSPFAAFGASCKNAGNWREEGLVFEPSLNVTIRARAADAGDGWEVQTRSYFTKDGESSTYESPINVQQTSIALDTGKSALWSGKKLALYYNQRTDKEKSTFNLFQAEFADDDGTKVACDVTLRGVRDGDLYKAKFESVKCTANGSAIGDLDKNAYVSCTRSFKNAANRFEVDLTLLDQN